MECGYIVGCGEITVGGIVQATAVQDKVRQGKANRLIRQLALDMGGVDTQ